MSVEKFDKIGYEFTLASGDHDWSDCNFYGEKNGKKTWIGNLASETRIYGSDEWWTYEDIEDFARKAVVADEMYRELDELKNNFIAFSNRFSQCGIYNLAEDWKKKAKKIEKLLKKARGEK